MKAISLHTFRMEEAKLANKFWERFILCYVVQTTDKEFTNQACFGDNGRGNSRHTLSATLKKDGAISDIPINLSNDDIYTFSVRIILGKSNIQMSSGEVISGIGDDIIYYKDEKFEKHEQGSVKLTTFLFDGQRKMKSLGEDMSN